MNTKSLIAGGNSGIGLATAKRMVNEGAYVFITGRREPELAAIKEIGRNVTSNGHLHICKRLGPVDARRPEEEGG